MNQFPIISFLGRRCALFEFIILDVLFQRIVSGNEHKVLSVNIFHQICFWLKKMDKQTNDKNNNNYIFSGKDTSNLPDPMELLEEISHLQVLVNFNKIF